MVFVSGQWHWQIIGEHQNSSCRIWSKFRILHLHILFGKCQFYVKMCFLWVLLFLSFYLYKLISQITCSTIHNHIIKYKAKLSNKNIDLRGNQCMTTFLDRQPLHCQNTFHRQFISAYKFTNHKFPISRYTQALN